MKRFLFSLLAVMTLAGCAENLAPVDYVDPMIGTGFHAHTYPGATAPFGMVQLSPDTRVGGWDACSGYHYSDNTILGFSHTHLSGTGCADLSDILFYPTVKPVKADGDAYECPAHIFSHDDEVAKPGYYSVEMDNGAIKAELTATPRTGVHRYTFNEGDVRAIVIDLKHTVAAPDETFKSSNFKLISDTEIQGYKNTDAFVLDQHQYFSARFSEPFKAEILSDAYALLTFAPDVDEVTAAVSLSAVSYENAQANGLAEVPVLDFDKVKAEAHAAWAEEMNDIVVKGGTKAQKINFYTAVYHTKICPNLMSDVDGSFRRHDNTIGKVAQGNSYYSTFSIWDTFRAWNPLQTIINTELVDDMVYSMLEMYRYSGELPLWPLCSGETNCMIGYHAVSVIADAYMKGIRNFDAEYALEAMVKSSNINRKGSELYTKHDFLPANRAKESVSITLEFVYDDWTIARMAEALGKEDIAKEYYERALNYMNVFDGSTCFFRGRNLDGTWVTPFQPSATGRDFTEATPWHYRFFVPHDVNGLMKNYPSKDAFIKALDDLFTLETEMDIEVSDVTGLKGQYAHGNEPSHHMAYLFSYVGQPWKTQKYTRELLDEMYTPTPDGIIGNEDAGQMSAWYVLSALGFYSVCPGSNEFVLTTPLFDEAVVKLANGKTLTIKAAGAAKKHYVKDVVLNGQKIDVNYITYDQIMNGGELVYTLSAEPCMERGTAPEAAPYSLTKADIVPAPYTEAQSYLFEGNLEVELKVNADAQIRYTLDGSEPTEKSPLYESPFTITKSCVIKAKAFKGGLESRTMVLDAVKAENIPAVSKKLTVNGVNYEYYEGTMFKTNMIRKGTLVEKGTMPEPTIANARLTDHYGYVFEGYVNVPEDGIWEFMTKTDDGSVMYVDGQLVVDNDGGHAEVLASGRIALAKGFHKYQILYFEDYEGEAFSWGWKAPGQTEFTSVTKDVLFCR
ncbi:MAG: GH92 family glycosyl hydrolase [Bacteroidales bacterium]|nr:GH92 family glycosyl hydrolase [Bacteroidales bacterium]